VGKGGALIRNVLEELCREGFLGKKRDRFMIPDAPRDKG
jgi:hypothetical protein